MAQPRSPRYPAIGLPEAIEGVRDIFAKEHLSKVAQDVIAKRLGSTSLNGRALSRISALRKYGLLSGIGDELRVTLDAVSILADPVESSDRQEAISRAAQQPTLFAKLFERFPGKAPSEEALRSYLMKGGYTAKGVGKATNAFLATHDLVTKEGKGYHPPSDQLEHEETVQTQENRAVEAAASIHAKAEIKVEATVEREFLRGPLSRVSRFRLLMTGEVGPEEIGKLIRVLELQRDLLAEDDAPETDD